MTGNVERFVSDMFDDGFREVEKGIYVKAVRGAVRVIDARELPYRTRLMYPNGQTGAEEVLDPSRTDYRAWIRAATTGQATAEFTSRIIRFVIIAVIVIGLMYFLRLISQ
jgi:hypothetical protein